ncbi:ribonuclease HII [Pseudomonadota bacterium]
MLPNFDYENLYDGIVAGIDEAGRGPLCGPVVASCVILNKEKYPKGLNDSKKLSEKKREELFTELLEYESKGFIRFGVGIISSKVIDEINIRNATKLAMKSSYEDVCNRYNVVPNVVLVDGNFIPEVDTKAECIVKGDAKSLSISAASIIAKVTRDKIMCDLSKEFPCYEWYQNKGYGTKRHIEKIKELGITKYHRKSFLQEILIRSLFDG